MKKLLLAVLADEMYANRLSDYIIRHKNMFDFMVFTNIDNLEAFIKHSKIDILLVDSDLSSDIPHVESIQKVIILSDGRYSCKQGCQAIFKYQPAGRVLKEIFAQIADDDGIIGAAHRYSPKQSELTVVFSPFGGAGVSTYAKKLCSNMSSNTDVLYINMEIFDSFAEFEEVQDSDYKYICGMSDAIFHIKQKKSKLAFKLESVINHHSDGYSYILPVEDYRDLYSITPEDMERFINVLYNEMIYEKVVFDVGYISEASLTLFKICDVLLLPEPSNMFQENKHNAFKRLLIRNGMEQVVDNIKFVAMKERCTSYQKQ